MESIDRMRAQGLRQELIDQFVETFPSYMFAGVYDVENARFLQQDTIDYGKTYRRDYAFKIFVTDSIPRFLEYDSGSEEIIYSQNDPNEVYVEYTDTDYLCGINRNNKIIANVTDKLRFQIDINTDDELEDSSPAAQGWDFRYGRTAYGFANVAWYPVDGDIVVIDSVYYDDDEFGTGDMILAQVRPRWMQNEYFFEEFEYSGNQNETIEYGQENDTYTDALLSDFTEKGAINIRMPKDEAIAALTSVSSESGFTYLATDTVFAVAVNDGHGGVAYKKYPVFVNFQPTISNDTLANALEGFDYNPNLLIESRKINVDDANVDQQHFYELIYEDDQRDEIRIDPCFPEAGVINLTSDMKTTPEWLKINKESGILYGTPSVTDAPKQEVVTVVVTDEDGLVTYKQFDLQVSATGTNEPNLEGGGQIICYEQDDEFEVFVTVSDEDLLRSGEQLSIKVLDGSNNEITDLTVDPAVITGPLAVPSREIRIFGNNVDLPTGNNGRFALKIVVEDSFASGIGLINRDTLFLEVQQSLPTNFTADITVTNSIGSQEVLTFGIAEGVEVSTGDGTDNNGGDRTGEIDNEYCEFELPPTPPLDVFDSRWTIPTKNGIVRSIYPDNTTLDDRLLIFKASFQAGGVQGGSGALFPITITWSPDDVPAPGEAGNESNSSFYIRDPDTQGGVFSVNMDKTTDRRASSSVTFEESNNTFSIVINDQSIEGFVIVYDYGTSVDDYAGISETGLVRVSPNPMTNQAEINFNVKEASNVKVEVVDNLGQVVNVLTNDTYGYGEYSLEWSGDDINGLQLPNGSYTVRMSAGSSTSTMPLIIVK